MFPGIQYQGLAGGWEPEIPGLRYPKPARSLTLFVSAGLR